MKLANYSPTFRNVLFKQFVKEKTDGGIYIPPTDFKIKTFSDQFENEKEHSLEVAIGDYVVLKVGKDCTICKPGDIIVLMKGIRPDKVESIDDETCYSVMEQQIIGVGNN
jgi:co-chaperonin GroES (HSP10)